MDASLPDWMTSLAILALCVPVLYLFARYGWAHLDYPVRLSQMFARAGLNFEKLPVAQRNLATFRCNACENVGACEKWLSREDNPEAYRRFCPNAELVNELKAK
jgi:hypothetical protein